MSDYTRKQIEVINLAWSALVEAAESSKWGDSQQLADALKAEKADTAHSEAIAKRRESI